MLSYIYLQFFLLLHLTRSSWRPSCAPQELVSSLEDLALSLGRLSRVWKTFLRVGVASAFVNQVLGAPASARGTWPAPLGSCAPALKRQGS